MKKLVFRRTGNTVVVDGALDDASQPPHLRGILTIHDPENVNPWIELTSDSGMMRMDALRQVIEAVKTRQHLAGAQMDVI